MANPLPVLLWIAGAAMLQSEAAGGPPAHSSNPRRTPIVEVFDRTHGAVVNISSTRTVKLRRSTGRFDLFFKDFEAFFGPRPRKHKTTSVGSGFVIHHTGYVVTNAHVVERTTDVKVTFDDQTTYEAETVAVERQHDLALLKIRPLGSLPVIRLGRSDDLMVGETVIAIGNPLGYQHTLTTGVISAVNRRLELVDDSGGRAVTYADLVQTDASINPGSSGGPLLNIVGELIGVNTAIRTDAENIGFAIPVDRLKETLPEMLRAEQNNRFTLGLELDARREAVEVWDDSPARRAGLKTGDVVTHVDGRAVESELDYHLEMIGHRPGDEVTLGVARRGRPQVVRVRLQDRPLPDGRKLALQKLGLILEPIDGQTAQRLGVKTDTGLHIASVQPAGPAAQIRVLPGDILTALGRQYVSDLTRVGKILEDADPGQRLFICIIRVERNIAYRDCDYVIVR